MRQVHSDRIAYVAQPGMYPECDALYTDHRDLWLAVKTADCLPILISSPSAVAAVHAGWRGLENGILIRTLETLINEFSLTPAEIYIHIGPHISQPNYEVEESFKHTFDERFFIPSTRRNHALLDLTAVAKDQAADEGVPDMNIYTTNMCTFDNADLFHSYRRAVKNGQEDYQAQLSFVRRRKI
jgi:YfiH family protein